MEGSSKKPNGTLSGSASPVKKTGKDILMSISGTGNNNKNLEFLDHNNVNKQIAHKKTSTRLMKSTSAPPTRGFPGKLHCLLTHL